MAVIYKIVCVVDDYFYIGSTSNHRRRKWEHWKSLRDKTHHCTALQKAWDQYGEDAFCFEVIEEVEEAQQFSVEDTWLAQHAGASYCYNTAVSAFDPPSSTPIAKQKISATLKALYQDKTAHPRYGVQHTEETKAKISANRVGKMAGEEHYRFGQTVSEEVRKKIGDTQRGVPKPAGRVVSEEGRAKIRANIEAGRSHKHWLGKQHTEEAKAKMRMRIVAVSPEGVVQEFDSLTATLEHFHMFMPTLRNALKTGRALSKGVNAGWRFAYADSGAAPQLEEQAKTEATHAALQHGEYAALHPEYTPLARSRPEAKASGVKYYYTGEACKHGHVAARKTKGACVECIRLEGQAANIARAEYFREYNKSPAGLQAKKEWYERKKAVAQQSN